MEASTREPIAEINSKRFEYELDILEKSTARSWSTIRA